MSFFFASWNIMNCCGRKKKGNHLKQNPSSQPIKQRKMVCANSLPASNTKLPIFSRTLKTPQR